ncbi:hypothetical protein ACFFW8_06365 [Erwinia tracheiphila]
MDELNAALKARRDSLSAQAEEANNRSTSSQDSAGESAGSPRQQGAQIHSTDTNVLPSEKSTNARGLVTSWPKPDNFVSKARAPEKVLTKIYTGQNANKALEAERTELENAFIARNLQ